MVASHWHRVLFALVLWACASPQPVHAADVQQYVVVYVELRPDSKAPGERLLDRLASHAVAAGALRFDVNQEVQRPNFYVLVETWKNQTDYQNFQNSTKTQTLLALLSSFLIAPNDERDGTLIEAGKSAGPAHAGEIEVVTHIDIIPTFLDQAEPLIMQFVTDSANDPGVKEFLLVSWLDITNHFQLIERYQSKFVFDAHVSAQHSVQFRDALQPFIGAPYDERVYFTHP
jgi:quinol monooxygenase YgiN